MGLFNQSILKRGGAAILSLLIAANYINFDAHAVKYDPVFDDGQAIYIKNEDSSMIPDKYNTGVDPSIKLTAYHPSDGRFMINGLVFNGRADMNEVQLDFNHTPDIKDGAVYVIENVDFTDMTRFRFADYRNFHKTGKKVKVIFKNCKFSSFSQEDSNPNYSFEFYDCDFEAAGGYNSTFVRCKFHPVSGDAMNPHGHVTVRDSYFYTKADPSSGERHLDGFQTFGRAVADMEEIHFNNVRIEIPKNKAQKENGEWFNAYINAAAMIAVEYSEHAHDVTLENMIMNGGGYTIYLGCSRDCRTFTDVTFKNVKIGEGHLFGMMYPYHEPMDRAAYDAARDSLTHVSSLYAGSAWKNSKGVHLSVSNDMISERTLTCSVDGKSTTSTKVKAHPKLVHKMPIEDIPMFEDYPYDLDIVVADANATSVDCYDTTDDNNLATAPLVRSIRFEPKAVSEPAKVVAKPAEEPVQKTAETKPVETKPAETKPVETVKPAIAAKPAETKPAKTPIKNQELPKELPATGANASPLFAIGIGGIVTLLCYFATKKK